MPHFVTSLTWGRHSRLIEHTPDDKDESQIQTFSPDSPIACDLPPLITTTERKLMAKVDWHVVPILCVMYLLAFLDRCVSFFLLLFFFFLNVLFVIDGSN